MKVFELKKTILDESGRGFDEPSKFYLSEDYDTAKEILSRMLNLKFDSYGNAYKHYKLDGETEMFSLHEIEIEELS